jgi:maltooligosyltrehalose trehalohydrolase
VPDPGSPETVADCRLDWSEPSGRRHRCILALHRDLLFMRRTDPVIAAQGEGSVSLDGAVLGPECFVLRYLSSDRDDRLLVVNLGRDLVLPTIPDPLVAPPPGKRWSTQLSSEDPRYGGMGTPPLDAEGEGWRIPGHAAVLLRGEAAPVAKA